MKSSRNASLRDLRQVAVHAFAILALLALAGCGSDPPNSPGGGTPAPTSTTYTGSVTGSTTSGSLTVTVATGTPAANPFDDGTRAQATVVATGVFTPLGGSPVTLAGTYDTGTKVFTITDGTWTFDGGLTTFGVEGSFVGPGGVSGYFSLFVGTSSVTVIVGTFTGSNDGRFNFAISGSEVHGAAWVTGDATGIPLDGTYSATTGHIIIYLPGTTMAPYIAEGDFDGTTASGTWDNQEGDSGDWSGTKQ